MAGACGRVLILYKDKDNPLLYMGPIWDFDISAGNVNYEPIVILTVPWMQDQTSWYRQWFSDPGFKADAVAQWNLLKNNGVFALWMASIPTAGAKARGVANKQLCPLAHSRHRGLAQLRGRRNLPGRGPVLH